METPRSNLNSIEVIHIIACTVKVAMAFNQNFHPIYYMYTKLKDSVVSDRKKIKFDIKLCMHHIFVSVIIHPGALPWGPLSLV